MFCILAIIDCKGDFGFRNWDFGFCVIKVAGFRVRITLTLTTNLTKEDPHEMNKKDLEQRTKGFALRIIKFVASLPMGSVADVLGYQLLKAGTSVGANYRAACKGKSKPDFIAKLAIVEEEAEDRKSVV